MIAVIEYSATANFKDSLLRMKRIKEAIMTAGVAPRWNQPRSFGGDTGGVISVIRLAYALLRFLTDLTVSEAAAAINVSVPVAIKIASTPNRAASGPAMTIPMGAIP